MNAASWLIRTMYRPSEPMILRHRAHLARLRRTARARRCDRSGFRLDLELLQHHRRFRAVRRAQFRAGIR